MKLLNYGYDYYIDGSCVLLFYFHFCNSVFKVQYWDSSHEDKWLPAGEEQQFGAPKLAHRLLDD